MRAALDGDGRLTYTCNRCGEPAVRLVLARRWLSLCAVCLHVVQRPSAELPVHQASSLADLLNATVAHRQHRG